MLKYPLFIVFEGIDGSGKSTQCDLLFRHAGSTGVPAVRLAEPTEGEWGIKIREMLKGSEMAPAEEQLRLFLLDRQHDAETNIRPSMKNGTTVIMDRYYYSNAAYQGAAGLSPRHIMEENRRMGFPEPDRVYFIDITPEEAVRRVSGRRTKKEEVFEKEFFLKRVRDIFFSLAEDSFLIIDGSAGIEEIFGIIRNDFDELVRSR
ncbi:MAG: dTMP kinase [Spirochaetes bacterium]|nr:dTMP kinase [Spirochaetota bacterium]